MTTIKTIADIRVANIWGWVPADQDPFNDYWGVIRQEIQIKDPSGKWTPVENVDINKDRKDAD